MKRKKGITRRSFVKKTTLASSAVIVTNQALSSCSNILKNDGPFFGNGCRNGWADQNSISIWSRLTEKPSANWKGEKFIQISKEEHKSSLSKLKNPLEIYKRQIPEGLKLKDMQGACLGLKGEVKLEYYPENEKSKIGESCNCEHCEAISKSNHKKCERCWHLHDSVGTIEGSSTICKRCFDNVHGDGECRTYA